MDQDEKRRLKAEKLTMQEEKKKYQKEKKEFDREVKGWNKELKKANKSLNRIKIANGEVKICFLIGIIFIIIASVNGIDYISQKSSEVYENKITELENEFNETVTKIQLEINNVLLDTTQKMEEDVILRENNREELNDYINALNRHSNKSIELKNKNGINYYQITKKRDLETYSVIDSGNDTIFPGAIVRGDSLFSEEGLALVSANRKETYLMNNQGASVERVENISYRNALNAIKKMHMTGEDNNAKEWTYHITALNEKNEYGIELQGEMLVSGEDIVSIAKKTSIMEKIVTVFPTFIEKIKKSNVEIKGNVGEEIYQSSSAVKVEFEQLYYTVTMEPKENPVDYFVDGTNLKVLGNYAPAYISSVNYGRRLVLIVKSDGEKSGLEATVAAALNELNTKKLGIDGAIEAIKDIDGVSCELYQYGGSSDSFELVVSFAEDAGSEDLLLEKVNRFMSENKQMKNPVPLSYTLKYLTDNAIVPSMIIEKEEVKLADNLKQVEIEVVTKNPGTLEFSMPNGTGIILTDSEVSLSANEKKIVLLWDNSYKIPLYVKHKERNLKGELNLSAMPIGEEVVELELNRNGSGIKICLNVKVSDVVNEEP